MSRMAATAIYNSRWLMNGRAERFKLVRITLKNNRSFCHLSLVICRRLTNPCEALKKPGNLGLRAYDQRGNLTAGQTHQPIGSSSCWCQPEPESGGRYEDLPGMWHR